MNEEILDDTTTLYINNLNIKDENIIKENELQQLYNIEKSINHEEHDTILLPNIFTLLPRIMYIIFLPLLFIWI